jgi:hypothetical protein
MFLTDPKAVLAFVGEWQQKLSTPGANHAAVFGSSYPNYNQFIRDIIDWMTQNNIFYGAQYLITKTEKGETKSWVVHPLRNLLAGFIDDSNDWSMYLAGNLKGEIKTSANFKKLWQQAGEVFQREGVPGLKYLQIAAIDAAFEQYVSKKAGSGASLICPREGYLAEDLENDQCDATKFLGNILNGRPIAITAASRFSGLEVTYAEDLKSVITDYTQGPGTVLQSLSALAVRSYAGQYGELMESILPVLQDIVPMLQGLGQDVPRMITNGLRTFRCSTAQRGTDWTIDESTGERMKNWLYTCTNAENRFMFGSGYFRPRTAKDVEQLRAIAAHVKINANKFALPMQIVTTEWRGMTQVHMLLAAPDLSKGKLGVEADGLCQEICEALVVAQYRAVAKLAYMLEVPLFVTRVGQGVFRNNSSVMKSALEAILKVAQNRSMTIFLETLNPAGWDSEIGALKPTYQNSGINFNNPIRSPQ